MMVSVEHGLRYSMGVMGENDTSVHCEGNLL